MSSIITNRSALQALQSVNAAGRELAATQSRVSTGLAVVGPKDNGAIYAIAQGMRAEIGGWGAAGQSLARVQSAISVASAASTTVNDLLVGLREKVSAYADPSLSASSKSLLREDIEALIRQVDQQTNLAEFDGLNLINGGGTPGTVRRNPTTIYSLPTSALTPQSFNTVMSAGASNSSWSSTMTTRIGLALPYSSLTPDSFAEFAPLAVASGTTVSPNHTVHSGSETWQYSRDLNGRPPFGDYPIRLDFEFDMLVDPDVIEDWQGGVRVAATGQAYEAGGGPVGPGAAVSGRQVVSFNYDPANPNPIEFRSNDGGGGSTFLSYPYRTGTIGSPPPPPSSTPSRIVTSQPRVDPLPATPLTLETSGAPAANGNPLPYIVDGGVNPGRVDLLFDASLTPDVVEIWQNGTRVAASGHPYVAGGAGVGAGIPTAGAQVVSFDYDPSSGQTLEFRFNENNAHPGAAWVVGGLVLQNPGTPRPTPNATPVTNQSVSVGVWDDADFIDAPPPLTPETFAETSASKTYQIDGGTNAGRVDIAFDAYDDADTVEVWQNGVRIAASGQLYSQGGGAVDPAQPISGPDTISFDYDPDAGRTLEFRFNADDPTPGAWTVGAIAFNEIGSPPVSRSVSGGPLSGQVSGTVFRKLNTIQSADGRELQVSTRDLTATGLGLDALDWDDAAEMVRTIGRAIETAIEAATYLGSQEKLIEALLVQNSKLRDTLETGIGNLVDADLARESAKLQAQQIRQQLAVQTLGIANAEPQWLLNLFRP